MIFPAEVSEADCEGERNHHHCEFPSRAGSGFVVIFEEVVEIDRFRGARIDAQAGALSRRRGLVQAEKRWAADEGCVIRGWFGATCARRSGGVRARLGRTCLCSYRGAGRQQ